MRYILLVALLGFLHVSSIAQINEGVAQYEVVSIGMEVEEVVSPMMKNILERFGDDNGEMFFVTLTFDEQSSFSTYGRKKDPDELIENMSYAKISATMESDVCYSAVDNLITSNDTWKDKTYAITAKYIFKNWEFTQNKKTINGYQCLEVIKRHPYNEKKIIKRVWYSEDIPLPYGPSEYIGFPGLVIFVSGGGLEMRLMDLKTKKVNVICDLPGISISKIEFDEIRNNHWQKLRESNKKKNK